MIRFSGGGFSGGRTIPIVGSFRQPAAPRLAQAPRAPESQRVINARRSLDEATANLRSAEDNLSMLDFTMGPEAALQALEEGRQSVERAQKEYERVLAEESA